MSSAHSEVDLDLTLRSPMASFVGLAGVCGLPPLPPLPPLPLPLVGLEGSRTGRGLAITVGGRS